MEQKPLLVDLHELLSHIHIKDPRNLPLPSTSTSKLSSFLKKLGSEPQSVTSRQFICALTTRVN